MHFDEFAICVQLKMRQLVPCLLFFPISSFADKDINHSCWTSSGDKKDLSHQTKVQNKGKKKKKKSIWASAYTRKPPDSYRLDGVTYPI